MRWIVLIVPFLLGGCLEVSQPAPQCFDIVNVTDNPPGSPVLLNKCTGQTWMLLRVTEPIQKDEVIPSYTYYWYPINQQYIENFVAGIKKHTP